MTTQTNQQPKYSAIDLYGKWTESAKDARWRYRDARVNEFHKAMDRAAAWSDGAAHVHTAEDIAVYLAERIDAEDTTSEARETYADMLNDVHRSADVVAELWGIVTTLQDENTNLRAQLADASAA